MQQMIANLWFLIPSSIMPVVKSVRISEEHSLLLKTCVVCIYSIYFHMFVWDLLGVHRKDAEREAVEWNTWLTNLLLYVFCTIWKENSHIYVCIHNYLLFYLKLHNDTKELPNGIQKQKPIRSALKCIVHTYCVCWVYTMRVSFVWMEIFSSYYDVIRRNHELHELNSSCVFVGFNRKVCDYLTILCGRDTLLAKYVFHLREDLSG